MVKKIAKQTPATLFNTGAVLSVFARLFKKDGTKTPATLFGTVLTLFALLSGMAKGSKTAATIYGTVANFLSILTGKKPGSKVVTDLYDTLLTVVTFLTNKNTNWANGIVQWITGNRWGEVQITITVSGGVKKLGSDIAAAFKRSAGLASGGIVTADGRVLPFAGGGYISGAAAGLWNSIPKYAHGTLFAAGEAGPEIVGHIGGRTEVLNRSQLAQTMYSAVHSAMQGVTLDANFYNADGEMNGAGMAELMEYFRADGEAMRQQNELLRQQNELLREINDKDLSVDISTADINRAQTRMNRRAGTTIVPVGT